MDRAVTEPSKELVENFLEDIFLRLGCAQLTAEEGHRTAPRLSRKLGVIIRVTRVGKGVDGIEGLELVRFFQSR